MIKAAQCMLNGNMRPLTDRWVGFRPRPQGPRNRRRGGATLSFSRIPPARAARCVCRWTPTYGLRQDFASPQGGAALRISALIIVPASSLYPLSLSGRWQGWGGNGVACDQGQPFTSSGFL